MITRTPSAKLITLAVSFSIALLFASCAKDNPADQDTPPVVETKVPLLAPGNLQITSMSGTEVKLKWADNSTNETSFLVEQSTDSITYVQAATVAVNVDSATVTGTFAPAYTYYFRVKAKNADTITAPTNIARRSLFPAPANLRILSFTPTQATLSWTDNSTNETGFLIERRIDSLQYALIDSTGPNTTSKIVPGVYDSSKLYSFRVVARSSNGKSALSNATARTLGKWVFVAGGTYIMGRADGYKDERQVHAVTLSQFYISTYEVTVKDYRAYTNATQKTFPAGQGGDNHPIVNVSWYDAADYCAWLDSTTVKGARLPTEAEWEYAARGGANTQHHPYSGSSNVAEVAWYHLNSSGTAPVGMKLPNELGIYDMSGNAFEWVYDWSGSYSYQAQTNPKGPIIGGTFKVFRGGSWFNYGLGENECRVETRYEYTPASKQTDSGFRIVKPR